MAYKNKTYIAFDGDNDMRYYRLMTAWSANEGFDFEFHNAHDLNTSRDSSQEESIKTQLRARFANSKYSDYTNLLLQPDIQILVLA